jgi:hypothetical protein
LRSYRLQGFPTVTQDGLRCCDVRLEPPEPPRRYEVAIYWEEEHNLVESAAIRITGSKKLLVTGAVDLSGKLTSFRVDWEKPN